ncbi:MAG: SCP2 sterol-binding domain-containing protein [Myxococcales bacterium]|nr:SCP2 sterol-binding domain-containing protein [Myxococcales bacterium]
MSPKDIFEGQLAGKIADVDLDVIYQFNITGDDGGEWVVDLKDKKIYEGEADDADCTITVADEDFIGLASGEVPGAQLFMMGKLQIAGDMGLAMKLGELLG